MKFKLFRKITQGESSTEKVFEYLYKDIAAFTDDFNAGISGNLTFDDNFMCQIAKLTVYTQIDATITNNLPNIPTRFITLNGCCPLIKGSVWSKATVSFRLDKFVYRAISFLPAGVTIATDIITITNHNFNDMDKVVFSSSSSLPAPLVAATIYIVKVVDLNTIRLLDSVSNSYVDLTSQGTGNHYIHPAREVEIMIF